MKIGYPCINRTVPCKSNRTFRLASYNRKRLIDTIENNLNCLRHVLLFNKNNNILFFRITSDLIPFASHSINQFNWQNYFKNTFKIIGELVLAQNMRISMHPDQFTLINSPDKKIFDRSAKELEYHATLLDLMTLPPSHKIQIHIGGVYGNKQKSMKRFITRYRKLSTMIKRRLVIENDDRNYTIEDCMNIHEQIDIPIVFDTLHHSVNNSGKPLPLILSAITKTWKNCDGIPMVDYSQQKRGGTRGQHAESMNVKNFTYFLNQSKPYDFDIMLEIKDKEKSATAAINIARRDHRFVTIP